MIFPLGALLRVPAAILVNRADASAWLVAEHREQLDRLIASLADAPAFNPRAGWPACRKTAAGFTDAVRRIQRHIRRIGDGVSGECVAPVDRHAGAGLESPAEVFAALRWLKSGAVFGAVAIGRACGGQLVAGAAGAGGGWLGGHPADCRHPSAFARPVEDAALRQRLIDNAKERAEHIMLIDLERNDLGRICLPGTVEVNELMAVASYSYAKTTSNPMCVGASAMRSARRR